MCHLKLEHNMRAHGDPWCVQYLLHIGGGTEETNGDGDVRLPDEICVKYTEKDNDLDALINYVFQGLGVNMADLNYITSRAIWTTWNDCVDSINMKMIDRFQGDEMVYHSFDSTVDDPYNYYRLSSLTL